MWNILYKYGICYELFSISRISHSLPAAQVPSVRPVAATLPHGFLSERSLPCVMWVAEFQRVVIATSNFERAYGRELIRSNLFNDGSLNLRRR
jgi:hypothetical protein